MKTRKCEVFKGNPHKSPHTFCYGVGKYISTSIYTSDSTYTSIINNPNSVHRSQLFNIHYLIEKLLIIQLHCY